MELVSIVIPVYNTGEPLRACLDSVVNQTYLNLEIIVVDDRSTDSLTLEILREYAQRDSRIKLIVNQENYGLAKTRNVGTSHVSGEYISFLDSDDIFVPDFIERMYQAISVNKTDFVVCNVRNFTSDNSIPMENDLIFPLDDAAKVSTSEFTHSDQFMKLPICAYGKLINIKRYRDEKVFFRDELRFAEDHDWSYRLFCQMGSFSVLNFDGIKRLLRPASLTHAPSERSLRDEVLTLTYKYEVLKQHDLLSLHDNFFFDLCCMFACDIQRRAASPEVRSNLLPEIDKAFKHMGYPFKVNPSIFDLFCAWLGYRVGKLLKLRNLKSKSKSLYKSYRFMLHR